MYRSILTAIFTIILSLNYLHATDGPAWNKQQVDKHENNNSNTSRDTDRLSNGGLISNSSASNNDFSFIRENVQQANRRPVSITSNTTNDYVSSVDNDEQLQISWDNHDNISQRDLLASGYNPQIAQDESGNLYATFVHDIGGAYGYPDGYTDFVVYKSVDGGTTWAYQYYIYNGTPTHLTDPDIEVIDDRMLFLYVQGGTELGLFWNNIRSSITSISGSVK